MTPAFATSVLGRASREALSVADPSVSRIAESLVDLGEIGRQVAAVRLPSLDAEHLECQALSSRLCELLERALAVFAQLDPEGLTEQSETAHEWSVDGALVGEPARIWDICFAGTFELRRVLRDLRDAETVDELSVALEAAHRKLSRAIRAVLNAEPQESSSAAPAENSPHQAAEIEAALAVRRLYTVFRRSLRRPTDDSPEALLTALRYAAGALAALVAAPAHESVRASDRALLRGLRERIIAWARHDRPANAGVQLLEDVLTCANLLRGINRRQELRAYDQVVIRRLTAPGDLDREGRSAALESLFGLDDELDALIERMRKDTGAPALAAEVRARLHELA
jgi:hypothetical protein